MLWMTDSWTTGSIWRSRSDRIVDAGAAERADGLGYCIDGGGMFGRIQYISITES